MSNTDLQQIELNIKQAKVLVDLGSSLDRLLSNRDFKKVINEGYFEQEAIRLVHLKADPNMQGVDSQKSIVAQMDAIGALKQFFQTLSVKANMATKAIEYDEQAREELMVEGL